MENIDQVECDNIIIMFLQVVKGDPAVLELDPVALWQEVNEFKAINELCKHMWYILCTSEKLSVT